VEQRFKRCIKSVLRRPFASGQPVCRPERPAPTLRSPHRSLRTICASLAASRALLCPTAENSRLHVGYAYYAPCACRRL